MRALVVALIVCLGIAFWSTFRSNVPKSVGLASDAPKVGAIWEAPKGALVADNAPNLPPRKKEPSVTVSAPSSLQGSTSGGALTIPFTTVCSDTTAAVGSVCYTSGMANTITVVGGGGVRYGLGVQY